MVEFLKLYVPAAIVAALASGVVGKHVRRGMALYVGLYCIALPAVAAVIGPGFSRWNVVLLNTGGLLAICLGIWAGPGTRLGPDRAEQSSDACSVLPERDS